MPDLSAPLARIRVPFGFVFGLVAFWLARPTRETLVAGGLIALFGEAIRIWAAGHLEKGREVTRSGPYRFFPHPLYFGSALMGIGLAVASRSLAVALVVGVYLGAFMPSAVRVEEAALGARFGVEYEAYLRHEAPPSARRFSLSRVRANREYRALAGLMLAAGMLALKARFGSG